MSTAHYATLSAVRLALASNAYRLRTQGKSFSEFEAVVFGNDRKCDRNIPKTSPTKGV